MKINVAQLALSLYGKPIQRPTEEGHSEDATVRFLCIEALLSRPQGESPTQEESLKRHLLARRLLKSDEVELSIEEASEIKLRVHKAFGTAVYGVIHDVFEAATQPALKAVHGENTAQN